MDYDGGDDEDAFGIDFRVSADLSPPFAWRQLSRFKTMLLPCLWEMLSGGLRRRLALAFRWKF